MKKEGKYPVSLQYDRPKEELLREKKVGKKYPCPPMGCLPHFFPSPFKNNGDDSMIFMSHLTIIRLFLSLTDIFVTFFFQQSFLAQSPNIQHQQE